MKVLVLGGTAFLSHATASAALARGHEVTCAARGSGGPVPDGARHVRLDRDRPDWSDLAPSPGGWDLVVDVARYPSWVREAVEALGPRARSWVYVSSCSVYADQSTPGQGVDAALLPALGPEADEKDPRHYGQAKAACEQVATAALGDRAVLARAGLIVGPGDPSGRFSYWPRRVAGSDPVLAPGDPDEPVQLVDVRDLARWLVTAGEQRLSGAFTTVGPPMPRAEMLAAVAAGVGASPRLVWAPQEFLLAHGVQPWAGDRSLPLWLPLPEYAGHLTRDATTALDTGLHPRPVAETAHDTLDWLRRFPDAPVTGLDADQHRELLELLQAAS